MKIRRFENEAYVLEETDTLNYVTKSSTPAQREKFGIGDIFINAAVCLKCKSYVRSRNAHDMRSCPCGAVAVDGGSHYAKRMGNPEDRIDVIELFHGPCPGPDCSKTPVGKCLDCHARDAKNQC